MFYDNIIENFDIKSTNNGQFVGYTTIKFSFVWKLFITFISNKINNIFHPNEQRIIRMMAISDESNNYNVYFWKTYKDYYGL